MVFIVQYLGNAVQRELNAIPEGHTSDGAARLQCLSKTSRIMPMTHARQNTAFNRFEMDVAGGTALAVYRFADGVMTFTHTEVPAALRGRGIGSQMMHGVLQSVRAQGFKVVPRCPFVANFIDRHPQHADLLA